MVSLSVSVQGFAEAVRGAYAVAGPSGKIAVGAVDDTVQVAASRGPRLFDANVPDIGSPLLEVELEFEANELNKLMEQIESISNRMCRVTFKDYGLQILCWDRSGKKYDMSIMSADAAAQDPDLHDTLEMIKMVALFARS